ncbi:TonB dependent/ligand-gated channel [Tenacibaculum jejuense]|uniref:TonB dependent/ligand-gated channel n=1 Tax=Tenacibaculum jejuense TaxID=584609 RepID=A0A238U607_9FLAO|nr:TonB-dependent receptor [Tenacibaculum jejuense]SNR14577.1 TonB dependent/ligand-gated channel [Tenacibaculum jejuense]
MKFLTICKRVKILVPLLFFSISLSVQAQSVVLSGKVVDDAKKPLIGATVIVRELKKGSTTDADGNFKIKLPEGKYLFEVSYLGYRTIKKKISSNTKDLVIQLTSEENVLEEVLVSSIRAKAGTPMTYSNVSKKEIAKRNLGQDIPVLLNYLPSVISSSDAGAGVGYTYMRVRGSDASRINVTINGIPYNDAESQGTFWVNLGDFASSTQSLQLQRGVGTSTNGSGAFGASLNILTDAVSEEAGGEVSNSFGSFGTRKHTVKFTTGLLNDHFELSGRLSNIYSDGYIDRAFTDLKSYFLQGSYIDDNTLIKAIVFGGTEQTYQAWFGTPEARLTGDQQGIEDFIVNNGLTPEQANNLRNSDRRYNHYLYDNETDNYWQDHYQLHWNEKFSDKISTNIGLNYTRGKGYFEQFKENENAADFNNLIADNSDVIVRRWLDNHFYVVNASATYTLKGLEIIAGGSYSNYSNDHYGEVIWGSDLAPGTNIRDRYYFSDAKKHDLSSFVKANISINDKLNAYVDLQGRFVSYRTNGLTSDRDPLDVDKDFNFFNPKLGLTYQVNDNNSLYASYARANREPNRNDFEGGNSQHETLDDFELGWRLNTGSIKVNTNVYYMDYKNQLVLSGAINNVGEPLRETSGSSYRLGLEIDASVILTDFLSIQPNVAFSANKNRDFRVPIDGTIENLGNTDISFSPNVIFGNALNYKPIENLQISFLSKFVGEQFMGNLSGRISDNERLDSYFTSDLNVIYEIKTNKIFDSIVLTGLVNNIFDREYVDRGYYFFFDDTWSNPGVTTTVDGAGFYPQATRNFLIGATLKF